MAAFVTTAAVLAALVLAIALRPLWRGTPWLALGLGGLLAATVLLLYRVVGTPMALDPAMRRAPDTLADAIVQLEAQLKRDPAQVEGWRLLGRAYASSDRPREARDAYARAAVLAPDQPDVLVEAAEASALADPAHRFDAASVARLERALAKDPQHQRARWFLGIARRQAGDARGAAATWEPLLAQVDAATAAPLRTQIDEARAAAGLPPLPAQAATPAPAAHALRVRVALDPAARARLPGDAVVFVIARLPGGPPMPVAVEKHALRELPFEATLDDADSPMPTQKLSALGEVELIARVSTSGDPSPQPGDLASPPVRVRLPAREPVTLSIAAPAQ